MENTPDDYRDYGCTIGEFVGMILQMNSTKPDPHLKTNATVNQDKMAQFLKSVEFLRRFVNSERDIGIDVSTLTGSAAVVVYLDATDIQKNEIERFKELVNMTEAISIYPQADFEVCLTFTVPGLFYPKQDD